MGSAASSPIEAALALRAGRSADAAAVADAVLAMHHQIDAALQPIIGQRGVAALYVRSVHLAGLTYPWLAQARDRTQSAIDAGALRSILAQQVPTEAFAGGAALLQTFCDLLAGLVGSSLTERLLHHVWAAPSSGPNPQDIPP